jgi:long-chain acyl-CoA synthetase
VELSFVAVDADGEGLRPFPGVQLDVREPRHGVGELWVRSPFVADGYLAGASGPLRRDSAGWCTVSDLAEPLPGGRIRLRGRGNTAVQTGAATVLVEDVESVLRAVEGVSDVAVVGTWQADLGEVVTAVVESTMDLCALRAALHAAAGPGLSAPQRPRRWYAVDSLPRTPAGKPARAAIAAGLADGTLRARRMG